MDAVTYIVFSASLANPSPAHAGVQRHFSCPLRLDNPAENQVQVSTHCVFVLLWGLLIYPQFPGLTPGIAAYGVFISFSSFHFFGLMDQRKDEATCVFVDSSCFSTS